MAKIKLNGDTSGYIEISAPAVSGNNTLELGPGTRILTNLDNTFTGVSTFSNGLNVTGGDVLVGTTDATIYNNGDSDSEGIVLRNGEVIDIARKGDLQLTLNRQTNDGPHIGFFRSGSPKTYISTRNDAFCIDTGGLNERLRITSDGNLLIGSDTGSVHGNRLLQVGKTDRSETYVSIVSSTSGESGLLFADTTTNDTGGYRGQIRYHHSDDSMNFRTGAAERVRITSAGLVGVNCTPLSQFQVKGGTNANIALTTMSSEAAIEAFNDAGSANVPLRLRASAHKFFIGSTEGLRVHTNGLIGVGYDSPTAFGRMTVAMPSQSGGAAIQVANSSNGSGDGTTSNVVLRSVNNSANQWADAEYRASQHKFSIQGTEKLRITSGGDLLLGGQTAYTYDDTGASNTILDIANSTNNKRGILSLSGNCNANGPSIGTIWFNNDQNSGTGPGATMKLAAAIQAKAVTSDSNAGDDSGAYLQFLTKPESAALAESMVIHSDGEVTKPRQPSFFSRPPGGYNLSTGGNTIGGTWSNIHNIGSHFSNGTFTAPVAGTYQFNWAVFIQSETNRLDAYILINGTNVMREEINGYPNTAANKSGSVHGCYYLSANDNVTFGVYTAAGTNIYVAAAPWSYASGFLVG